MVEEKINEIGRMGRSRKQKEDGMESRKAENEIGNAERTRGTWMRESRNVEAHGESFRPVAVARGTSGEGAARSRDVECWRRQRRRKKERHRPVKTSIDDRQ
jgi:hypothetical protein